MKNKAELEDSEIEDDMVDNHIPRSNYSRARTLVQVVPYNNENTPPNPVMMGIPISVNNTKSNREAIQYGDSAPFQVPVTQPIGNSQPQDPNSNNIENLEQEKIENELAIGEFSAGQKSSKSNNQQELMRNTGNVRDTENNTERPVRDQSPRYSISNISTNLNNTGNISRRSNVENDEFQQALATSRRRVLIMGQYSTNPQRVHNVIGNEEYPLTPNLRRSADDGLNLSQTGNDNPQVHQIQSRNRSSLRRSDQLPAFTTRETGQNSNSRQTINSIQIDLRNSKDYNGKPQPIQPDSLEILREGPMHGSMGPSQKLKEKKLDNLTESDLRTSGEFKVYQPQSIFISRRSNDDFDSKVVINDPNIYNKKIVSTSLELRTHKFYGKSDEGKEGNLEGIVEEKNEEDEVGHDFDDTIDCLKSGENDHTDRDRGHLKVEIYEFEDEAPSRNEY